LGPLVHYGEFEAPLLATLPTVTSERLPPQVLLGKQLFYDARDPRLARDAYLSCASCHAEGGQDGRVWDLTGEGEGLRNTKSLVGRAGASRGRLHWSLNFDEVQDFEGQIRALAGGTGLLPDAVYGSGSVSDPLGAPKAGLSVELDALAAYLEALGEATPSPHRDGLELTAEATAGRVLFQKVGCTACHYGDSFSDEEHGGLRDIGTLKGTSGQRLFGPLLGIGVPSLLDAWNTGPYLHDGSAATLTDAILAHEGVSLSSSELQQVASYVRQLDGREPPLPKFACADAVLNGSETDVDCGGSCAACPDGARCESASDCQSLLCEASRCVAQPTCFDEVKNGTESDIDCGGGCGSKCELGQSCSADGDCTSSACAGGICADPPSCEDGQTNQDETDVDCGGSCAPCQDGSPCADASDCVSERCLDGACSARPSCCDGLSNQDEGDVEGGGRRPLRSDGRTSPRR